MNILVFGAGAIGSAFGGFLSKRHAVTLIGRKEHLEVIRKQGLKVTGIWGRHTFHFHQLEKDARQLKPKSLPFDLVLITVKSYDTEKAAKALRPLIHPQTLFISLQNGLGNIETLEKYLPKSRILAGRVIFGVELKKPGTIHVSVMASPTAIGEVLHPRELTPRAIRISKIFEESKLPCRAVKNIQSFLWAKVIYNAALNPLASLLSSHYGFLGETALTRAIMEAVIKEIYAVAEKARIPLYPKNARGYQKLFYSKLLPRTYHHHPSMLQDLQRGKPTEINALNGMVVKLGRRFKVPVPFNAFLTKMIRGEEKKRAKKMRIRGGFSRSMAGRKG